MMVMIATPSAPTSKVVLPLVPLAISPVSLNFLFFFPNLFWASVFYIELEIFVLFCIYLMYGGPLVGVVFKLTQ